jgi:hypothetical protein
MKPWVQSLVLQKEVVGVGLGGEGVGEEEKCP